MFNTDEFKAPFDRKARGYWPKSHVHLISLNFRGFIPLVGWLFCSFLDTALLFWFLSKSYGFLASNFKLLNRNLKDLLQISSFSFGTVMCCNFLESWHNFNFQNAEMPKFSSQWKNSRNIWLILRTELYLEVLWKKKKLPFRR